MLEESYEEFNKGLSALVSSPTNIDASEDLEKLEPGFSWEIKKLSIRIQSQIILV